MKFSIITNNFTLSVFSVQGRAEQDLLSFQPNLNLLQPFVFEFVGEETVDALLFNPSHPYTLVVQKSQMNTWLEVMNDTFVVTCIEQTIFIIKNTLRYISLEGFHCF